MKKLVALLLTAIAIGVCAAERPVVKVETDSLQGAIEYGMQVFKNFPYAATPVGDLRWHPP
jgi:para-nitrobenzyl esterase